MLDIRIVTLTIFNVDRAYPLYLSDLCRWHITLLALRPVKSNNPPVVEKIARSVRWSLSERSLCQTGVGIFLGVEPARNSVWLGWSRQHVSSPSYIIVCVRPTYLLPPAKRNRNRFCRGACLGWEWRALKLGRSAKVLDLFSVECIGVDKTYLTFTISRVVSKSEKTSGVHIIQSRPESHRRLALINDGLLTVRFRSAQVDA